MNKSKKRTIVDRRADDALANKTIPDDYRVDMTPYEDIYKGNHNIPLLALKPRIKHKITEALNKGAPYTMAANYAGISISSFWVWMRRGAEEAARLEELAAEGVDIKWGNVISEERIFLDFFMSVERARAAAGMQLLSVIANAAKTDPKWAAYRLSKMYPDEFGDKVSLDQTIEVKDNSAAAVSVDELAAARKQASDWEANRFSDDGDDSPKVIDGNVSTD